jgi:hypothetical protein
MLDQCEIDLSEKRIDPRDFDADIIAQAEFFAVVAAFDDVLLFVINVVTVGE